MTIESTIKNLITSLKAVTELQNPAIKDRHWLELMMLIKVCTFLMVIDILLFLFYDYIIFCIPNLVLYYCILLYATQSFFIHHLRGFLQRGMTDPVPLTRCNDYGIHTVY